MRTKVWNNTTFTQIPDGGDNNWPLLTNFLVSLADNAQTTNFQKSAIRLATTTPITVAAASDHVVVAKLSAPAAVTVNLPAGSNGQEFLILDGTGDAATNNITINRAGANTINGATTLVISANNAGYKLKYSAVGTDWKIVGSVTAAMDNAEATRLGLYGYLHGTTYNGGLAPTIGGTSITGVRGEFFPYQLWNGDWRLKGNVSATWGGGATTSADVTIVGIVSKNVVNFQQSFTASTGGTNAVCGGRIVENTNIFSIYNASTSPSRYLFAFDISLNSKPTWAY